MIAGLLRGELPPIPPGEYNVFEMVLLLERVLSELARLPFSSPLLGA